MPGAPSSPALAAGRAPRRGRRRSRRPVVPAAAAGGARRAGGPAATAGGTRCARWSRRDRRRPPPRRRSRRGRRRRSFRRRPSSRRPRRPGGARGSRLPAYAAASFRAVPLHGPRAPRGAVVRHLYIRRSRPGEGGQANQKRTQTREGSAGAVGDGGRRRASIVTAGHGPLCYALARSRPDLRRLPLRNSKPGRPQEAAPRTPLASPCAAGTS